MNNWLCPWASIILWDLPWAPTPCCWDTCQESQDLPTYCLLVLKGLPVDWNQYIRFYFIWSFIQSIFFLFHIWFITLKYTQVFVHHIHVKFNWQRLFNLHSNNVIMHGYLPWLDIFWTSCTWNDTDCGKAWHTGRLSFQSGTPANKNHGDINPQYIKPGSGSK